MTKDKKIKGVIIDDEPLAVDLLMGYCSRVPQIELLQCFNNPIDAFTFLSQTKVDFIFLDIQMPKLSGLEFIKSITDPPLVIFTTAFREYAVEGFELDAVDYLVKPIQFVRFMKSIGKVKKKLSQGVESQNQLELEEKKENHFMFFKQDRQMVKVYLDEILWIESMRDYVKISLQDSVIITYKRISILEQSLPHHLFCRIHKSFIVALDKIISYNSKSIYIDEKELPIGAHYKKELLEKLNRKISDGA